MNVITITHHARGYSYVNTPDKVDGFVRAFNTFAARYVPSRGWLVYDDKWDKGRVEYLLKTYFPLHTVEYVEAGEPAKVPSLPKSAPTTAEQISVAVVRHQRDSAPRSFAEPKRNAVATAVGWDV